MNEKALQEQKVLAGIRPARPGLHEDGEPKDWDDYNGKLAKLLQRLKKETGAETVKGNYRGTGAQKARRQIWVRWKNGAVIDLWLDKGFFQFSGVVMRGGTGAVLPKRLEYGDKTPEQFYGEISGLLKAWAGAG